MKGIPSELLYVLLFVGVMLIQYVLQRVRTDTPQEDAQARPPHDAPDEPQAVQGSVPAQRVQPPRSVHLVHEQALQDTRRSSAVPERPRSLAPKRFSRHALFGGKRRTQDAVVAAAILGPCRAFLPHDNRQ